MRQYQANSSPLINLYKFLKKRINWLTLRVEINICKYPTSQNDRLWFKSFNRTYPCQPVQRVVLRWSKSLTYSLSNWFLLAQGCYTTAILFLFFIPFWYFRFCHNSSAKQYHYIYVHYLMHYSYNTISVCRISFSEVLFSWIMCLDMHVCTFFNKWFL